MKGDLSGQHQVEEEGDLEIEIRIAKLKNSKDQGKSSTILYFALVGGLFVGNSVGWFFFYKEYFNKYNEVLDHLQEVATMPNNLKVVFISTYESVAREITPLMINSKGLKILNYS
jgi:hypothetical protein